MRRSGLVMLALALVFGLISVFMARGWLVQQARQRPAQQAIATTTVVIAKRAINYGDEIRPDLLTEVTWPSNARPEGSFTKVGEVLDGSAKRMALRSIEANEPLLKSKISGFGQKASLSAVIDGDKRAMTIRVNDVIGVAGFVLPGDRVDVLLTRQTADKDYQTDLVLQNLRVFGVDQEANDAKDKPAVARAVTLEVTTAEAQKLALAGEVGRLTLALRNGAGSGEVVRANSIHVRDLAAAPASAPAAPPPGGYTVNVVRAIKSSVAEVHAEK